MSSSGSHGSGLPCRDARVSLGQLGRGPGRLRVCVLQVWPAYFAILGGIVWCVHPLLIRLWAGHALRAYPLAGLFLLAACLGGFVNTFSVFLTVLES